MQLEQRTHKVWAHIHANRVSSRTGEHDKHEDSRGSNDTLCVGKDVRAKNWRQRCGGHQLDRVSEQILEQITERQESIVGLLARLELTKVVDVAVLPRRGCRFQRRTVLFVAACATHGGGIGRPPGPHQSGPAGASRSAYPPDAPDPARPDTPHVMLNSWMPWSTSIRRRQSRSMTGSGCGPAQ